MGRLAMNLKLLSLSLLLTTQTYANETYLELKPEVIIPFRHITYMRCEPVEKRNGTVILNTGKLTFRVQEGPIISYSIKQLKKKPCKIQQEFVEWVKTN